MRIKESASEAPGESYRDGMSTCSGNLDSAEWGPTHSFRFIRVCSHALSFRRDSFPWRIA